MDERLRVLAWVLAGGGLFGLVGVVFGAVTGVVTWTSGRAAGTGLGLAVARAFARAAETELSRAVRGALTGGADGFVFLGLVGMGVGAFAATRQPRSWQVLSPAALTTALIAGAAVAFGTFAALVRAAGPRAVLGLFIGGIGGAALGMALGGIDSLLLGSIIGSLAGTAAVLGVRWLTRRRPAD